MLKTAKKPLDGIRVMDLTRVISGPYATRLLADAGAEVIKVEPHGGEYMRQKEPVVAGESAYFGHLNAGKKSITVDFRDPGDMAKLRELARHCDVVVENFRPGVARTTGLDYATLSEGRDDLVYCSISGFGQEGPRSGDPAYAPILHALSGHDLAVMNYAEGAERPLRSGVWYGDLVGGVFGASAIQSGLIGVLRHGTGQYIDLSLMDTMINMLVLETQEAQNPATFDRWLATPVKAADGYVMAVPITKRAFERAAEATGNTDWLDDARFNTQLAREENWQLLLSLLEQWTIQRPALECERILMEAGVPCGRYQTVGEAIEDPQVTGRNLMSTVRAGEASFQVPNLPFLLSDSDISVGGTVPGAGEHNEEVFALIREEAEAS